MADRRPTRQSAFPATGFEGYETPQPEFYTGGDPLADKLMQLFTKGPKDIPLPTPPQPPPMFRRPSTLSETPFRSQQPPALDTGRTSLVEGPGEAAVPFSGMTRTPGGVGETGAEWTARQPQGQAMRGVGEPLTSFFRPTEELFKQSFPQEGVGMAPGAQQAAGRELYERIGPSPAEQLEIMKSQMPVRQQEVAGQYGLQQEALKGQYGLQQKQAELDALRQGYETLRGFLGTGGQGGLQPGASISMTGIGSYRAPTPDQTPQGLLRDLTAAKSAWEQSENFMGSRDEQLGSQYRQALGTAFGQDPAHPSTKEMAMQISTDPEWSNMPISQLINDPRLGTEWDTSTMSDEDWEDLDRLLNYSRGAVGF